MVAKKDSKAFVLEWVKKHPGKRTKDIEKGLKGRLTHQPIFNALTELETMGQVENRKAVDNQRNNCWYAIDANPLVSIPNEVDKFSDAILSLLSDALVRWEKLSIENPEPGTQDQSQAGIMFQSILKVLRRCADYASTFSGRCLVELPTLIPNESHRVELINRVLARLVTLQERIVKLLKSEKFTGFMDYRRVVAGNFFLVDRYGMNEYYEDFSKIGLGSQMGEINDLLWSASWALRDPDEGSAPWEDERQSSKGWRMPTKLIRKINAEQAKG